MEQYTTEWAREILIEIPTMIAVQQDADLEVYGVYLIIDDDTKMWYTYYEEYGKMLEHPDGWQNSLVTREML